MLAAGMARDADYCVMLMTFPATLALALEFGANVNMRGTHG